MDLMKIGDKEIHAMLVLVAMGEANLIPEEKLSAALRELQDIRNRKVKGNKINDK